MMKLGEAAYSAETSNTGEDPSSEQGAGATADDVVDADFEEIDENNEDDEENMKKAN